MREKIYCKPGRGTMQKVSCELRKRKTRTDGSHVYEECQKCPGPVPIDEKGEPMTTEKQPAATISTTPPPELLCVECKVKPFNPKYRKIKLCGSCLHKKRKATGKTTAGRKTPKPAAKQSAPDPAPPTLAPRSLEPMSQPGKVSGTLVTYAPQPHSSAQEVTYKALDLMEQLQYAGVDAEMIITIVVP